MDPVDGTEEFINGSKEGYSFLASLLQKQANGLYIPVAGIIYLPSVDKLWYTDGSNEVVFVEQGKRKPLPTLRRDKLVGAIRGVHPSKQLEEVYHMLGKALGLDVEIVYTGGTGASISHLLEGKINMYLMNYNYSKGWDVAAVRSILTALGGFTCGFDGSDFMYNGPNPEGHDGPYNLQGIAASVVFKKSEILPHLNATMIENQL